MMMMPFVRLIAIYAIVGAAIFAFLKRDQVMAYFATPQAEMAASSAASAPEASPTAPQITTVETPATETTATAEQPVEKPATYSAPPAFGTQVTPQYFGQTPAPAPAPQATAPAAESMVARWTKAREVFSQGHPGEAAKLYETLIADYPENADLHGEAGNLYYNLGQFSKAATHYQAVGEIAGRAGNRQMAGSMLALLQRIAPAKAAELQAALNAGR
jgi:tetratricopeptide (TPR) repeat protein